MKNCITLIVVILFGCTSIAATNSPFLFITDINSMNIQHIFDEDGEIESQTGALAFSFLAGNEFISRPNSQTMIYAGIGLTEAFFNNNMLIQTDTIVGLTNYFHPYPLVLGLESSLLTNQFLRSGSTSSKNSYTIFDSFNATVYFGLYADALVPNLLRGGETKNRISILYSLNFVLSENQRSYTYGLKVRVETRGRTFDTR